MTIDHASERARELRSRMTLEEKIGQMCMYPGEPADVGFDDFTLEQVSSDVDAYKERMGHLADLIAAGRIGSLVKVPGSAAARYLQECAGNSRLGVPLLIGTDAIHGHTMYTAEATVFPTPISLASSFDADLVRRVGEATAAEMKATAYHWTFAPNVDVVRDQRWGRTGETFGEDPLLVSTLGAAMTIGLQQDGSGVVACAKHLIGSGEAFNGINGSEIDISDRTLETHHVPPFRACIDSGVRSVMAAHHAVNGVPCHAHPRYLKDELFGEWGFDGIVVSDWMDVGRLHKSQRVAGSFKDACVLAVNAGIDVYMAGDGFFEAVLDAVEHERIGVERIDEAVERILTVKYLFGLFDRQETKIVDESVVLRSNGHTTLAREAARSSLVLLKNRSSFLPLSGADRILVTGPLADSREILGDWVKTVQQRGVETIFEAMARLAPEGTLIDHCPTGTVRSIDGGQIDAACARAKECDAVLVFLGENSFRWTSEPKTSGENCDRSSLFLPGRQVELVERLCETGARVVAVIITSRANAIPVIAERAEAVLFAWEPGMYTGEAIANAVFGAASPSGRLPVSIPRSSGHLRCNYDRPPLRLSQYGDSDETPSFPFGYGLGYGRIRYEHIEHPEQIVAGETLRVSLDVVHEGGMETDHSVLVFIRDEIASVTTPERKLASFVKIRSLKPGERRAITIEITAEAMSLIDARGQRVVEPGSFEVMAGDRVTRFEVTELAEEIQR